MFCTERQICQTHVLDAMPLGQRREHAQYVTSLKIYFRPRLTAVFSLQYCSLVNSMFFTFLHLKFNALSKFRCQSSLGLLISRGQLLLLMNKRKAKPIF